MSELNAINFSDSSFIWMGLTCILLFLLPLLYVFIWRHKCGKRARFKSLFIGAAGFLISARVLELGVHVFCILLDNPVSRFINGHIAAYVIYGICMAGIFEECGRYIILRYLVKKENTRENAVMYGIGHGGIEVWAISLVSILTFLAIGIVFRVYPLQEAMNLLLINDTNATAALPAIQMAAAFGAGNALVTILERILCMFIHIALTVIVYHGVQLRNQKHLLLAVFLHMMVDLIPAISQKITLSSIITEGWLLIWMILLCMIARKLYHYNDSEKY